MDKMTKRAMQARETQLALITTAKKLISERGFDNVTIDEICSACGVSKGTFYHYFKTKYDIIELDRKEFLSSIDQVYRVDHEEDIATTIVLMMNSYVQMVERRGVEMVRPNPAYFTGDYEYPPDSQESSIGLIIQALLQNAVEEKLMLAKTPVDVFVSVFSNYVFGLISNWCSQNGAFSMVERCNKDTMRLVNCMLRPYKNVSVFAD